MSRNKQRPPGKRQTKLWRERKKAVARAPSWLKTAQIAKSAYRPVSGTFGAASECVRIDPKTGEPIEQRASDHGEAAAWPR
jgi:hypothetical protein